MAAMIDNLQGRNTKIHADYLGFTCPDYFVVGMDAGHAYRELPFVGIYRAENGKDGK